jgi:ferrochelatase
MQPKTATLLQDQARTYDAIFLVSHGGPETLDDVAPFLKNVTHGANLPESYIAQAKERYRLTGGGSPINANDRALIAALRRELDQHGISLPIYWGNLFWQPYISDAVQQMDADGVQRALAFFTSPYSSYYSCREYREAIEQAQVGTNVREIDKIRAYFNHPGFIEPMIEQTSAAFERIVPEHRDQTPLIFTMHSIPTKAAQTSAYVNQAKEACRLVAEGAGQDHNWTLVYQNSSSGHVPWLEPDICDYIRQIPARGTVTDIVVVPIGFVSDHEEVVYNLDIEAKGVAAGLGINMIRVPTVGTHPKFVSMIRELVVERMTVTPLRRVLGRRGPGHDICPAACCPKPF